MSGVFFLRGLTCAGKDLSIFRSGKGCGLSVTPRIVVDDTVKLIDFLRRAFGGAGEFQADRPTVMHIGDSVVMVSSAGAREAMRAFLYVLRR
jgi:hypothetical protein